MPDIIGNELLLERRDSTLILTLNRPDKRNALSASLVEALLEQVETAARDGTRLLVLKGNGRNFCAGFDFGGLNDLSDGELCLRFVRIEELLQAVYHAPFATLALAHGRNFGAGVDLICSTGQRIADRTATFRMPGLAFGIVLGTRRFASRVGISAARQILQETATFDTSAGEKTGFLTAQADQEEWPHIIEHCGRSATLLPADSGSSLYRATVTDTRCEDMADLARSASRPGLKDRIRRYRG